MGNSVVEPLRDKSLFWHHMWADCGRPRSGNVADIMRSTRAAYIEQYGILNDKFAFALMENRNRDFSE